MPRAGAVLSQPGAVPSPGRAVSQHKENAKVGQHRAASLGSLAPSPLHARLPRVYCCPLRLPGFSPPDPPLGAQPRREEDGEWGKGHAGLEVPSPQPPRSGFHCHGQALGQDSPAQWKGVISRLCALHDTETAKQAPSGCAACYSPPSRRIRARGKNIFFFFFFGV